MLHQPCKEEFSDWPIELLAIGTFGNNQSLKDPGKLNHQSSHSDHLEELTPEEVGELHKEFKLLLCEQIPSTSPDLSKGSTKDLEKFFDCLQNLEDDRKGSGNKESHLKHSYSVACGKGQEAQLENTTSGIIGKKSASYFLKKAFLYRGGLTAPPPPLLRDPISQSKFEKLRLEKILRAILHKKIVPQASSTRATMKKKYLDKRNVLETDGEDEEFESVKDRNKWDNSDSECKFYYEP
ncbi:protein NEGATIVE GRAVITROPIC RESPONSE OF ROOTS-like [Lycium ferocissimum]|uniref:protein NEGATIVE GRAVITROPIC RESPONSE OF ROOTS-like n=1 Tax=Lycium ferocissimum TaxID=112874 RepID=UPI002815EF48|nr:protein NEGATIVE GRAVITROPIC RESPONSE OF ROOTS-like [Lycium ferocissimum]XP_059318428.1 protein NEGATIVE GRAVITROPIC RESPONSE OF ROOTS-like [Lycium ferocissimum]